MGVGVGIGVGVGSGVGVGASVVSGIAVTVVSIPCCCSLLQPPDKADRNMTMIIRVADDLKNRKIYTSVKTKIQKNYSKNGV